MFFKKMRRNRRELIEQRQIMDACEDTWYFRVEFHRSWGGDVEHLYFNSIKDAEYWYLTERDASMVVLTDRCGNRIFTDWTPFHGTAAIKVWTQGIKRCVLDTRKGGNVLWVPETDARAKNANKILT